MRGTNPVLSSVEKHVGEVYEGERTATYAGIAVKTLILLGAAILSGVVFVLMITTGALSMEAAYVVLGISVITTFVLCMVSMFSRSLGPVWGILYAVSEGIFLGLLTAVLESLFSGIAFAAILGTVTVFLVMLFLYMSKTIRVSTGFVRFMSIFGISILVGFLFYGIMYMFAGNYLDSLMYSSPWIFMLITVGFILYGAFMLIMQFDSAKRIVEGGADKKYEWQVAVGFMLALIWIYIEILRLLTLILSRRN